MPCVCYYNDVKPYARYYDSPDGRDVDKKVMVASRYGITAGLIMGTYDVMMYSHAVGFSNMLKRYLFHTVPLGIMGATFAVVSNAALSIRQKDDEINYFLGGLACGPILSSYLGSKHAILLGGLALGAIGFVKKSAVMNGWTFLPPIHPHMNAINSWRNDYSLVEDPKEVRSTPCQQQDKGAKRQCI